MRNLLKRMDHTFMGFPLVVRLPLFFLLVSAVLILTQDAQIFPGALTGLFESTERRADTLPAGVESNFIETSDGERLEVWSLAAKQTNKVALIFHGNGGDIENYFPYQQFFKAQGITSYAVDFRGYGKSSGWPSEQGLYNDADALLDFVTKKEKVASNSLIIAGVSIGTGPAAYIAAKTKPSATVLVTPYTSLPDVISATPLLGIFRSFSFYEFPVARYASDFGSSCLIVAHGVKDRIIPFDLGRAVFEAGAAHEKSVLITHPSAGHNEIFFNTMQQIATAVNNCLKPVESDH